MHIPDGFLSIEVSVAMWVIVVFFWIIAFKKAKKVTGDKHIPFLSVIAAAIFGGQMLNFSLGIFGGTSGHLLGAALATILFGPYGALIILTLVLVIQALIFADGGIIVLGANILNMGIIGGFTSALFFPLRKLTKNTPVAAFIAAWFSIVIASFVCALQLGFSSMIPLDKAILAMVPIHAVIGIGEGLITVGVISFIHKTRPDLLKLDKISP